MDHSPTAAEHTSLLLLTEGIATPFTTVRVTKTMIDKNIVDAHVGVRELLFEAGLIDYAKIAQGDKILAEATLCVNGVVEVRTMSFYRPKTKGGDPRFWLYDGRKVLQDGDLIVLGTVGKHLWVTVVRLSSGIRVADVAAQLGWVKEAVNSSLATLKEKLQSVASLGWVPSMRNGDTGVGFTLESLLGIAANSSKEPDYQGIEIKSKRAGRGGLQTLFTKTPDWNRSQVPGTTALVNQFGYLDRSGRQALYCTVKATANPQGFHLRCASVDREVHVMCSRERVLVYPYDSLRTALERKHPETVFVAAETRFENGQEQFFYSAALYCSEVSFPAFIDGIADNRVSLDLAGHIQTNGVGRDHGYL